MVTAAAISQWLEKEELEWVGPAQAPARRRTPPAVSSIARFHTERRHRRRPAPAAAVRGPRRRLRRTMGV